MHHLLSNTLFVSHINQFVLDWKTGTKGRTKFTSLLSSQCIVIIRDTTHLNILERYGLPLGYILHPNISSRFRLWLYTHHLLSNTLFVSHINQFVLGWRIGIKDRTKSTPLLSSLHSRRRAWHHSAINHIADWSS